MVNPGDVVDLDRFTAMMVVTSGKALFAEDGTKLLVQKDYVAPPRAVTYAADPIGAAVAAINALTQAVLGQKGAQLKGV